MDEETLRSETRGIPVRNVTARVTKGADLGLEAQSATALTIGTADDASLRLTDRTVSRYHVELRRAADRIAVTDLGSTNGTIVGPVLTKGSTVWLAPGAVLRLGRTEIRVEDGETTLRPRAALSGTHGVEGVSEAMDDLRASIGSLAGRNVPVLLLGESGTGKEVIARALYEEGARKGPFVTVDCGALSPNLVASELFGHERGAFSGAHARHIGAFERANGGTLFIDEIGELPRDLQPMLLGALERQRIRRVGGQAEIEVDVRVVCATHRDLREEVNRGTFRLDLYYRIAVVLVHVPPLRERLDDLVPMIDAFLRREGDTRRAAEVFDAPALAAMRAHPWPGNLRELRNVVSATLATGSAPVLVSEAAAPSDEGSLDLSYKDARRVVTEEFERRYLARVLERAQGNVREAARLARMDRSYLIDLLKRHSIRAT